MESISRGQLYAVLVSVRLFEYVTSLDVYSREQALGLLVSGLFQVVIVVLLCTFRSKVTTWQGVVSNGIVKWLYVGYCVAYGGVSLSKLVSMDSVVPSSVSWWVSVVLFAVTVWYCAKLGFKALFRSSVVVTGMVVVSYLVVLYGVVPHMEVSNLYLYAESSNVYYYTVSDLAKSVDLVFLALLMDTSYRMRDAVRYVVYKVLTLEVLSIVGLCVLGGVTVSSDFPFIDLASYSQPFGIQRSDAMYSLVTPYMCVLNVSLAVSMASRLLSNTIEKYSVGIVVVAMVVVSYCVGGLALNLLSATLVVVLGSLVPILLNLSQEGTSEGV